MISDSLQKRYSYKLVTNLVALIFNIIIMSIVPRGLGPKVYGDFNFLTNFFSQLVGFLDAGTSTAFYTKLARRPRETGLVSFYFYFTMALALIILLFLSLTHVTELYVRIWPGQKIIYIYLAAGWGIMTWAVNVLNMMADAYGLTVPSEKMRILQKVLALLLILSLFMLGKLGLWQFFGYHYSILLFMAGAFIWLMNKKIWSDSKGHILIAASQIRHYAIEFYRYSNPLLVCSALALVTGIFDRWLLQVFSGSVQQGFYSLSYQVGTVCFLFTSAMTPLLMREFSISFGKNDIQEMGRLFQRYVPMLYSIAAFFSCFIVFQAEKVVSIMGGQQFTGALAAVMIMAFYPIHQTYGQLSASVFFASGQTVLYRNISIFFLLAGLPITYFLIAPTDQMGLNAGAIGLALKMVFLNMVGVNIQVFYNTKLLNLRYWRYLSHQLVCVGCLLAVAAVSGMISDKIIVIKDSIFIGFLFSGILYTAGVIALAFIQPWIMGLNRKDMQFLQIKIKSLLKAG